MPDNKDVRKLNRRELLELLVEQSKRIDRQSEEIASLKEQLEKKELTISRSGSLAEAAVNLSGFFEAADKAVETYAASVKATCDSQKAECARLLEQANAERTRLIAEAAAESDRILAEAREEAGRLLAQADIAEEPKV